MCSSEMKLHSENSRLPHLLILETPCMNLWSTIQNFVAIEALAGTVFALWIGFLAWRGPKQQSRGRYQRILRPIRMKNAMIFKQGNGI